LEPAAERLETAVTIIEDEFDRRHALGGPTGDRSPATNEIDQVRAQSRRSSPDRGCADADARPARFACLAEGR
jgi:hypothetical protein